MPFFFPKNKVCACRTLAPERYAKHYVPHRELHIPAERFCVIRNEVSYYIKKSVFWQENWSYQIPDGRLHKNRTVNIVQNSVDFTEKVC